MKKSLILRATMFASAFTLSYCVMHVPNGKAEKTQQIEVGSCAAVRAHINNHPGDMAGVDAIADCGLGIL